MPYGKYRDAIPILKGINCRFYPGHIYGIIGYTACGKSTLLRQIAGLNDPELIESAGHILIPDGWRTVYLFQQPSTTFNPLLSIEAHLMECYGGNSLSQAEKKHVNDLLKRYKLCEIGDRKLRSRPSAFSVGELQRYLWVMTIASAPELILLDEAFAHVDSDTVESFVADLRKLADDGCLIIIASHLRELIYTICDTTYELVHGRLREYEAINTVLIPEKQSVKSRERAVLEIRDLSYQREGEFYLFQGIDMEIYPGETVGLYGDSGVGKSTLAQIIAGRIKNYKGEIYYNGRLGLSKKRVERAGVVQYLPQNPVHLFPPEKRILTLIRELVELHHIELEYLQYKQYLFPDIASIEQKKVVELSGGQRQILLFFMAVLVNPSLLLIDENFTAMDPELMMKIWKAVCDWQEKYSVGILLISHRKEQLEWMCNRSIFMKNG